MVGPRKLRRRSLLSYLDWPLLQPVQVHHRSVAKLNLELVTTMLKIRRKTLEMLGQTPLTMVLL